MNILNAKAKKFLFTLLTSFFLFACGNASADAKPVFLYIPMDDRPVCLDYTKDTLTAAGIEVLTPDKEILASRNRYGDADKLWQWMFQNAKQADAVIVSADSLLYGGLVPSRIHNLSSETLQQRLANFEKLRHDNPDIPIYVFSTLMRSPQMSIGGVEPPYYEKSGPGIFRYGALLDKKETNGLNKKEQAELDQLVKNVPESDLSDWYGRRAKNFEMNRKMMEFTKNGTFDYFVLGRDDNWPYSQSRRELRPLMQVASTLQAGTFSTFPGADQLGILLMTRAFNHINFKLPFVYAHYAPGAGPDSTPSYQDNDTGSTVRGQILAIGGFPVTSPDRADLILGLNTPFNGHTPESESAQNTYTPRANEQIFIKSLQDYMKNGKKISVADIAFANGSNNAFMAEMARQDMLDKLQSYGGWNTASNASGYAVSQGVLADTMNNNDRLRLLSVRYLDEWAYQANVRQQVKLEVLYPQGIDQVNLGANQKMVESETEKRLHTFIQKNMPKFPFPAFTITHPWSRMFEVGIVLK